MKLRIKGNSVRLRLTKPEVAAFASTGAIIEETILGPSDTDRLIYGLQQANGDGFSVNFGNNRLLVRVPVDVGKAWSTGEDVGFSGEVELSDKDRLQILVEKDFFCLSGCNSESPSDYYEHQDPGKHC